MRTLALLRSIDSHFFQHLPWKNHMLHFDDPRMFPIQVLGRNVIGEDPPPFSYFGLVYRQGNMAACVWIFLTYLSGMSE